MIVHWHRRDLRGVDNRGLELAADRGSVLPAFVVDPSVLAHASPPRVSGMLDALAALRSWYQEKGSDLLVARGDPSAVLPALVAETGADGIVWNEDYSGLAGERDRAVVAALEDEGVDWESVADALLHEPGSISPNRGDHYSVFSYFWKKWRDRPKVGPVEPPDADDLVPSTAVESARLGEDERPTMADLGFERPTASTPTVTPDAARERLARFCEGDVYRYAEERDYPAAEATSRLSVHLKWGTIGIRTVYAATERAHDRAETHAERESVDAFRRQLAWREFYAHVLAYNPETVTADFADYPDPIEWRTSDADVEAWAAGETGYPIVDAGMRQLRDEAWIHNRVRMIVASFLTKDLLIDWREGYDVFRERLADHDTANDVGGWQWAASTGTDAQPYFRIFNPMTQGERFDPDAEYVREHVPELADADPADVHRWHELSDERREEIAPSYPAPIVNHADRREAAIETFERARGQ